MVVLETHCYVVIATTPISRAGHWRKKDRDFLFNRCHYDDRAMDAVRTVRKTKTRVPKLKSIINELVGDDDVMNPRFKSDLFAFSPFPLPPPSLLQVRGHSFFITSVKILGSQCDRV